MKKLNNLIEKLNEVRIKRDELKLWLSQKEVVEYYKWKNENPKDRTAMDKVIAQLKMLDEDWLLKEQEFLEYSNLYSYYSNYLEIIKGLVNNSNYNKEIIEKLLDNIKGI